MKTLLVPVDFSPNAAKALDFAVQIAKKASAKIVILHATDLLEIVFKDHVEMKEAYNQKLVDEATGQLDLLEKSIEEAEAVEVITLLYKGALPDSILSAADKYKADMIVMGTLGNSAAKEKLFGSKTAALIGRSGIPVLAVPLLSEWSPPAAILLAVNDLEEGRDISQPVFDLAGLFNATVHLALFTDKNAATAIDYLQHEKDIHSLEARLKKQYPGIAIQANHLEGAHFRKTLEAFIAGQNIDILAMVTHKRSLLENIFDPSLTRRMSYHTRVPLLALPA